MAVGVHGRDNNRAALVAGKFLLAGAADAEDDIGIGRGLGAGDLGARSAERLVIHAGFEAGAAFDDNIEAEALQFLDRVGRSGNARFRLRRLLRYE